LFIELIGHVLSKQFNCKVNELPGILSKEGVLLSGIPTHLESFLFDQLGVALDRRISIMIFNDSKSYASWQELETENGSREKERVELSIISGLSFDINDLLNFGFARVGRVSEAGEYSLYGDVMILWPPGWKSPLRISFFGEEVESISIVTTEGFKHVENLQSIKILGQEILGTGVSDVFVGNGNCNEELETQFIYVRGGALHDNSTNSSKFTSVNFGIQNLPVGSSSAFMEKALSRFVGLMYKQGYKIVYVNSSNKEVDVIQQDLKHLIEDNNVEEIKESFEILSKEEELGGDITIFNKGCISDSAKVLVLSPYELYGEINLTGEEILGRGDDNVSSLAEFSAHASRDKTFKMITPGDYIVHEDHGVGLYKGLREMNDSVYFELSYAGKDRLFVPVAQSKKVTKFIGAGRKHPILTPLNSGAWRRIKAKVEDAADELAKELIQIYAMRSVVTPSLSLDTEREADIQKFIDAFPYEDTPDQLAATHEILTDLKSSVPMDRLIVGDVGFGKTEVALRAIMATVVSGGQVAVLAPTTILVEQHAHVLAERMKPFGIKVCAMSRFLSAKEVREIVERLKGGDIDVVVGTHALLSDKIEFKKLGLIVIDEEQKFGVGHKEKMKQKRVEAHVLALSATPIPRTLNLSLTGIRDISIIATPPKGRLPVKNYFQKLEWDVAVKALTKEIKRGGQAYFLHNRVNNIDAIRKKLQGYMPKLRIEVAHGQLKPEMLALVMSEFAAGKIDILVSTTIIENGIDLANVNTLVVNDSQRFGLSQLYQIRGRIGRSQRQAYAHFMYSQLSGKSSERMDALAQAEGLGSGFILSSRDLEIRGAGNILGKAQSGSIDSVGYGLYMSMLQDKLQEYKKQLKT
jgi:transcription-repair coupling factor (superfamily II helicase)